MTLALRLVVSRFNPSHGSRRRMARMRRVEERLFLAEAGQLGKVLVRFLLDHVDHVVHRDAAKQRAARVGDRERDEVVLSEQPGHFLLVRVDRDRDDRAIHHRVDGLLRRGPG